MTNTINEAVQQFWSVRSGGTGVLGGKTLDGFIKIIKDVVTNSGLNNIEIYTGRNSSQLPGFFRPHKSWDVVVIADEKLVAAIELKSQVGSIGNNFNNRTEEVLGSGIDLHTAVQEEAFGQETEIFRGYLILVEDSDKSRSTAKINMNKFPVMHGFLNDEAARSVKYIKNSAGIYPIIEGVSYLKRYDILCKKLVLKDLYTAAALIIASEDNAVSGEYRDFSPQTSINTFLTKLDNHCKLQATYQ
jgi:type II restriction enzyme